MTFIETYTLVTRFNLTQIQGNQVVDWAVVDGNYQLLGNNAAHLTAGNAFSGSQTFAGNIGLTGAAAHRRITLPVPPTNETDRVHFQAETAGSNGTFLGLAGPVSAGAGQRKSTLVIHGVEPTGVTTPAGLTFLLDEDNHRSSIQALGTYQDLTTPSLQLGAGGTDRLVIPSSGVISVTGAMTLTGALTATGGAFTTLSASAGASFATTTTFTGLATFNGGISSASTLTVNAPINVTGLATFSGGITTGGGLLNVTGNTTITGTLTVSGATTLQSTLSVTGAATFGGAVRFAAGASYIQALAADTTQVQVSGGLTTGGTITSAGSVLAAGNVSAGSQIYTTPAGSLYLRGADGDVHIDQGSASLYVNGRIILAGILQGASRGWFGNYDGGQAFNVGGNIQVSSFVYQRGSTAYRCYDTGDFAFGVGIAGNTLVQRDASGFIQAQSVYMPSAAQPGKPTYVVGQNNDGYMRWWPASAVGPPASAISVAQAWDHSSGDPYGYPQVSAIAPDRTGYWWVSMRGSASNGPGEPPDAFRIDIDGVGTVDSASFDAGGSENDAHGAIGLFAGPFLIGPGNIIRTYANRGNSSISGTTYALFSSVQGYPN